MTEQKISQPVLDQNKEKPAQEKKKFSCFKMCLWLIVIFFILPIALGGGYLYYLSAPLRYSDERVLNTYQPTTEIADIATKVNFTDKGKAMFYRADPRFVNSQDFIQYCKQASGNGVEALACIAPKPNGGPFGGRQIFLLQIDDPQFADHKYSAAVHETLHGAFDRLNETEKKKVENLLNKELTKHQDDSHLLTVMDSMKKGGKKTSEMVSELHSKFGIEYASISPELEEYYQQYFADRQQVVKLYQEGGFNSRVRKMDELKKETDALMTQITSMRSQLNDLKNISIDDYNNKVPKFNLLVDQYNSKITEGNTIYNEMISFYQYFNPNYQPPKTIEQQN